MQKKALNKALVRPDIPVRQPQKGRLHFGYWCPQKAPHTGVCSFCKDFYSLSEPFYA
jgi:hypothetical protein